MFVTYRERKPGIWRVRIETGRDQNGVRCFSYETVRGTQDDAARRRFELLSQKDRGVFAAPDKITLIAFMRQWIENRKALEHITRSTAENYTNIAEYYIAPRIGGVRLQKVTGSDVQNLYTTLVKTKLSRGTIAHVHRILSAAFKAARRARLITINPIEEVDGPGKIKARPQALDEATAVKLMQSLSGDWKEPIVAMALGTGLRRGELCGLRWRDVDLDGARVHVRGQLIQYRDGTYDYVEPKTESGLRTVAIAAELVDMLRALRIETAQGMMRLGAGGKIGDGWVFTRDFDNPIRPGTLTESFTLHCEAIGLRLKGERGFTFHGTRHTHLTALLRKVGKAGAKAVSERAGHADLLITLRTYDRVFESDDRNLAELSSGLFGVPKVPRGGSGKP